MVEKNEDFNAYRNSDQKPRKFSIDSWHYVIIKCNHILYRCQKLNIVGTVK